MPPQKKTWSADPHTLAKIRIVGEYLKAWLPKMTRTFSRVIYIDAFAGPGVYDKGEKGSPLVALETALNHSGLPTGREIVFQFIDQRLDRITQLEELVAAYDLRPYIKVNCIHGEFDEQVAGVLDRLQARGRGIAPTFCFVDPFGVSGTPMSLVRRLLANPSCEVLVNVMVSFMVRFAESPEFESHMTALYGSDVWRRVAGLQGHEREEFLISTYVAELNRAARFTWRFRMIDNRDKTSYYLVFGGNHIEGLKEVKRAMWRISPTKDYSFSDRIVGQEVIFGPDAFIAPLRDILAQSLSGQTLSIHDIETYAVTHTPFLDTHLREATLRPMEQAGKIRVVTSPRKRGLTYPNGTVIQFP